MSRARVSLLIKEDRSCTHHFGLYFSAKSLVTYVQLQELRDMAFLCGQPGPKSNSITVEVEKNDINGHLVAFNHQRMPIPKSLEPV